MTDYDDYRSALRLIADEPGERAKSARALDSDRDTAIAPAHTQDREVQARWATAARRLRDVESRTRRLASDAGIPSHPAAVAPALWTIEQVDAELSALERDFGQAEAASAWIIRARAQVNQLRSQLGGHPHG